MSNEKKRELCRFLWKLLTALLAAFGGASALATREGLGVSPLTALIAALSAAAGVSACYTVNL